MTDFRAPTVDWAALSPELILLGGAALVLLLGVWLPVGVRRPFAAGLSALCLVGAGAAAIVLFVMDDAGRGVVADAIRRDQLDLPAHAEPVELHTGRQRPPGEWR